MLQTDFPLPVDQACGVLSDCIMAPSRLQLLEGQTANDLLNGFQNGERSLLPLRRQRNLILRFSGLFSVGLIYPVLNPVRGKQVVEIIHVARDHDVAASQSHRGDHYISVPLSRAHAAAQRHKFGYGLFVHVNGLIDRKELLRRQQPLLFSQ